MRDVIELLKWFAAYQANPHYDWNADPDGITLKTSQAIAFMEKETAHQAVEWGDEEI